MGYDAVVIANAPTTLLSHYYPLSGVTAADAFGGLDGTLVGGVAVGQSGFVDEDAAMSFDGVSGEITFASNWIPNATGNWGVDFWFKFNVLTRSTIVQIAPGIDYRYDNSPATGMYLQTTSNKYFMGDTVIAGQWYYATCGLDDFTGICTDYFYPQHGGGSGGTAIVSGVGKIGNGTAGFFNGLIQKVGIYQRPNGCSPNSSTMIGCPNVACLGGTLSVIVTPNPGDAGTINYSVSQTWLHVSGPSSGAGTATITVDSNAGGVTRTGYVRIGNQVFTVQQVGGC